jgi:hypothetical protein
MSNQNEFRSFLVLAADENSSLLQQSGYLFCVNLRTEVQMVSYC